jgi:RNA polymerase sigma-70 factor (ECF subfamily)
VARSRTKANTFRTTQWTLVLQAGSDDSVIAAGALAELCQRYWFPIYAWVRRSGYPHADAADLTQSFFARIIENNVLAGLSPAEAARFRSFLLTSLKNFLISHWQSANRQKRGGGSRIISLDDTADELYCSELTDHPTPDRLFDKRWAMSVVQLVLDRMGAEFIATEKPELFDPLKGTLTGDKLERPYAEVARSFGLSEGAIKVAVHRMRKRFGELLRAEVAETVGDDIDVKDEVRHLINALGY